MWIDWERRHGVVVAMFWGRMAYLYGANGEGTVAEDLYRPSLDRRRRVAALLARRNG